MKAVIFPDTNWYIMIVIDEEITVDLKTDLCRKCFKCIFLRVRHLRHGVRVA